MFHDGCSTRYSTEPPAGGFRHASAQAEVDALDRRAIVTDYDGSVTIESFTVMHERDGSPALTIAACLTPDGGPQLSPARRPRQGGDCPARNDFLDEGDAPAPAFRTPAPDVEAQVHFFEGAVEWNRQAPHARVQEKKSDHAAVGPAVPEVELGPGRDRRGERRGVDLVVEHRQEPPLGGEKDPSHFPFRSAAAELS